MRACCNSRCFLRWNSRSIASIVVLGAAETSRVGNAGGGGVRCPLPTTAATCPSAEATGGAAGTRRPRPRWNRHRLSIRPDDLHQEEVPDRIFLEPGHHSFEHVEGFLLVSHQRILLRISAKADALLQVVHVQQVIFPQTIEHAEHDHALVEAHLLLADKLLLGGVPLLELVEERLAELVPREIVHVWNLGVRDRNRTARQALP